MNELLRIKKKQFEILCSPICYPVYLICNNKHNQTFFLSHEVKMLNNAIM